MEFKFKSKAMSLVELMIAGAILVIVALGIAGLIKNSAQQVVNQQEKQSALEVRSTLSRVMSELKNPSTDFDDLLLAYVNDALENCMITDLNTEYGGITSLDYSAGNFKQTALNLVTVGVTTPGGTCPATKTAWQPLFLPSPANPAGSIDHELAGLYSAGGTRCATSTTGFPDWSSPTSAFSGLETAFENNPQCPIAVLTFWRFENCTDYAAEECGIEVNYSILRAEFDTP
jgi:type II secretory pathway pseudopilin PulG